MSPKKIKILLVEDDLDQVMMYQVEAKNQGVKLLTASKKDEALSLAEKEKPDLILLDMLLGEIKGTEILKDLKKNPKTKSIEVIFLTNFKNEELCKKSIQMGASEYIIKSDYIPQEVLQKVIKKVKK
ncbi:MAG: response regulator [Candidatus Moranbacteria bacterium]|nr:response regulator [Candidatus Moranbacteria bacterium]